MGRETLFALNHERNERYRINSLMPRHWAYNRCYLKNDWLIILNLQHKRRAAIF